MILLRTKWRTTLKIVLGAAVMMSFPACRDAGVETDAEVKMKVDGVRGHEDAASVRVIRSVCSWKRPFRFGGRRYTVTLFRRGDRFFLRGRIEEGLITPESSALKELGKNIALSPRGPVLENGRMTVEYRDSAGKRRKACVPFGDVYGSTHVSEMPPFIPDQYPESEKYDACGLLKRDEPVIASCVPTLQALLRRDDAETLAGMMVYPLLADVDSELIFVKDRKEFVELYPRIFTPQRKRKIMRLKGTDVYDTNDGLWVDRGLWLYIANDDRPYFYCLFLPYEKVLGRRLANQRLERK